MEVLISTFKFILLTTTSMYYFIVHIIYIINSGDSTAGIAYIGEGFAKVRKD